MAGRPNKYKSHIEPKLEEIKKLCQTMTEKQVAECMGVGYSTWCDYKNKYPEFSETVKKAKEALIHELKSVLIMKAKGYTYTEKKTVTRETKDGKVKHTEVYEKYAQPDTGALHLLLKNIDENWRNDDTTTVKLKQKQVELSERKVENEEW